MSRENFEWNKNDFCQQFRNTGDATAFIAKWKALTSFDVVTQSTYPTYHNAGSVGHVSDSSDSESVEIPIASDIPNDRFVDESSPSTSELTSHKCREYIFVHITPISEHRYYSGNKFVLLHY